MSLFGDLFKEEKPRRKRQRILEDDLTKVMQRQKFKCAMCPRKLTDHPKNYEIDHKKPLSEGGTNNVRNLQALCKFCHSQKSDKETSKKARKRRKEKRQREDDPFTLENILAAPKRRRGRKRKSMWDI
jgi:5-methylcytosine-specific restriction endonuclease McrA